MPVVEDESGRSFFYVETGGTFLEFDTGPADNADSNPFGTVHCFWETKAFFDQVRSLFQHAAEGLCTILSQSSGQNVTLDNIENLEEELAMQMAKAEKLISDLAPLAFMKAQFDLVIHVLGQLLTEATTGALDENGQPFEIPLVENEVAKELIGPILQEIQKAYNERRGIRRGGARKGGIKLSEEEIAKLRARKTQLIPFWEWLLSQLKSCDYEEDAWPSLQVRRSVQMKLQEYEITASAVLDELIEEALKRRPYLLKEITEPMPKSLSPSALAQRHACLEQGIDGEYETIRKQLSHQR